MSLDNFQIPLTLVTELYKDSLVVLDAKQIKTESLTSEELKFIGKNEKKILILVNDNLSVHLSDKETEFLSGILIACKLSFNDMALVNVAKNKNEAFEKLFDFFTPQNVILFGIEPDAYMLPIEKNFYQIYKLNNCSFLSAPGLDKIAANTEEKKLLWTALKKLFSL
jgi:hypothetical protein